MNVLDATRAWLRANCPHIDKQDRFNANYLGAEPMTYTLRSAGQSHRATISGGNKGTYKLVFEARLPYGAAVAENLSAADLFARLDAWLRAQDQLGLYPQVEGGDVTGLAVSNAGLLQDATAGTARYQLQLQLTVEEAAPDF